MRATVATPLREIKAAACYSSARWREESARRARRGSVGRSSACIASTTTMPASAATPSSIPPATGIRWTGRSSRSSPRAWPTGASRSSAPGWCGSWTGWARPPGPSSRPSTPRATPPRFAPFHYRFTRGRDVAAAVLAIHRLIDRHGSLRAAFVAGYSADEADVRPALHRFAVSILEQDFRPVGMARPTRGFRHLFPDPATGGACKRWHLFLRWMIRRDPPDFGDWREVSPSKLLIPLDTHIANMAHAIRLTRLRTPNGAHVGRHHRHAPPARPGRPGEVRLRPLSHADERRTASTAATRACAPPASSARSAVTGSAMTDAPLLVLLALAGLVVLGAVVWGLVDPGRPLAPVSGRPPGPRARDPPARDRERPRRGPPRPGRDPGGRARGGDPLRRTGRGAPRAAPERRRDGAPAR